MHTRLLVFFLAVTSTFTAAQESHAGQTRKSCWDSAMSQPAMNECALSEYKSAESDLNRTYNQLLKKASGDAVAVKKIKAAQKAWLVFRDT